MALMYTIFNSNTEGSGATVIFSNGTVQQISSSNPNFNRVVTALTSTPVEEINEEELLSLLIPALAVGKSLNRLSERVSFDGANILFDGDIVNDAISDHILRIINEGGNADAYKALVNFMEKLYTNPSEQSRNSLYEFIVRHNITIDPDGDFYAYKGVRADGTSRYAGFGIVDGVSMNGHLPNNPGSILEMPRAKVDADNAQGCSVGLHAGTYDYALGWSRGMLLLVKINPRDVVSVPDCTSFAKIRTCRYKVISQTTQQTQATTYTAKTVTNLHSINTLDKLTKTGAKVPVTFTYTRGNGQTITVELVVSEIRNANGGESIVIGEDTDGETRSYRATYISELVIDSPALRNDAGHSTAKAATATADKFEELRKKLANDESVLCDFNYVKINGDSRTLENFVATSIRTSSGWNPTELLVGGREDGKIRTYRLDRITDFVIQELQDDEPDTDDVDIKSILAAVVQKPDALIQPVDVSSAIIDYITDGNTVTLSFDYTTVAGESRQLRNFKADGLRNRFPVLLVGEREDGEIRTYRLDRIKNVVIHSVS